MSEISDYNSYNIDDLVTAWKSGWRCLEEYASRQYHQKLEGSGDEKKSPLERVHSVIEDVLYPYEHCIGRYLNLPKTLPDCDEILNLAASNNRILYGPPKSRYLLGSQLGSWVKDKAQLYKSLQKVTKAFATSDNYNQAFSKIANKTNLKRFTDYWSQQGKEVCLPVEIEPRLRTIMKWLEFGLSDAEKCREAWWNCLWIFMEPIIKRMNYIKEQINDDTPLYREQLEELNYYISHGYPITNWLTDKKDGYKIQIVLRPHPPKRLSTFDVMIVILLVQPAFNLAQQLQASFTNPRFIKRCRAPSCGKTFYTGRKNATNCPGSQGNKKTPCSLEWIRYKRWLVKIGKDPQTDWDSSQLRVQFISSQRD